MRNEVLFGNLKVLCLPRSRSTGDTADTARMQAICISDEMGL
jgi:hypothetical protein